MRCQAGNAKRTVIAVSAAITVLIPITAKADTVKNDSNTTSVHKIKRIKKEIKAKVITKSVTMGSDNGGPITAISKKVIERDRDVSNAESVLNNSPGVNVTTSNPIGVRVHTSIRGFKGSQIGYTYDNLPITNLLNGGLTGGDSNDKQALYNVIPLTLGQTDGINIQFGPTPTNVNSFGAMGGTVEYLPRLPSKNFYLKTFAGYGSFDTRLYGAEVNTGNSKSLGNLLLRFSSRQTNNYLENSPDRLYSYYGAYTLPSTSGRSIFSAIFMMNLTNGYVPSHMPVELTNKYGPNYQFPLSDTYAQATGNSSTVILGYKTAMTNRILLDTKLYYQYQDFNELTYESPNFYNTSPYIGNIPYYAFGPTSPYVRYRVINQALGVSPTAKFFLGNNYNYELQVGGLGVFALAHDSAYFLNTPSAPQIQTVNDAWDEHQHRLLATLFAQAKLKPLPGLTLYPGIKEEYVTNLMNDIYGAYEQGDYSGNEYRNFTPYFGVSYKLSRAIKTYANFGINYKYPNMSAYYAADQTSPPHLIAIHPEKVQSYQIGAQYKSNGLNANIAFYRQAFTNVFSSYYDLQNGLSYQYNFGSARYQGINIGLNYNLGENFDIYTNYSLQSAVYTSSSTALNGASVNAGDPKQYTPTYLYNIGVSDSYHNLYGSLWATLVGPQYIGTSGGAPTTESIPAYKTVNLSLAYTVPIQAYGMKKLKLSFNVMNLLNSHSYSFEKQFENSFGTGTYLQGQPLMGRYISSELALTF